MSEHKTYSLRRLRLRDAVALPSLVKDNEPALRQDFPDVITRHGRSMDSLRSIRRAQANATLRAFTIRETVTMDEGLKLVSTLEEGFGADAHITTWAIGIATAQRGTIMADTGEEFKGVYITGWLDSQYRGEGIGLRTGRLLLSEATELANEWGSTLYTGVRPANAAASGLARKLGLQPVGAPGNYASALGDSVVEPRQLFVASLPVSTQA